MENQKKYEQTVYNICQLVINRKYKRAVPLQLHRYTSPIILSAKGSAVMNFLLSKATQSVRAKDQGKRLRVSNISKAPLFQWPKPSTVNPFIFGRMLRPIYQIWLLLVNQLQWIVF